MLAVREGGQVSARAWPWTKVAGVEPRRSYVVFFALVTLVAAAGVFLARRSMPATSVLAVVPADAWLVVTVDVRAIRASGLAPPLASAWSPAAAGLGDIPGKCGFDPLERLNEIVLASPEGGEKGDFGLAFQADVPQGALSACANKVISARGGTPATSSRAGYAVIEDSSDTGHARLAYREGGPLLVGRGEWLDRMIDRASARAGQAAAGAHVELGAALSRGATAPAMVLTAVLPRELRQRLKGELGVEPEDGTYASVLSVEAAGIAMTTGPAGSTTGFAAELRCETASACEEVKRVLERRRTAFSRNVGAHLVGLGPLLDSVRFEQQGAILSIFAQAPTDDLAEALGRVLHLVAGAP